MLLDHWGELQDLQCESCDDEDKRSRGCGQAPIIEVMQKSGEETLEVWTPRAFAAWCARYDAPPVAGNMVGLYDYADRGEIVAATGTPWRCCPQWYHRFAPGWALDAVNHALTLLRWRQGGAIGAIKDGPMLAWETDLVAIAARLETSHERRQAAERQRKAEQARNAGGRGGAGGRRGRRGGR